MGTNKKNTSICPHCSKNLANFYTLNRHLKLVHKIVIERKTRNLIFCPLCPPDENRKSITCYNALKRHFIDKHDVTLEEKRLTFPSCEDFEKWRKLEARNVDYNVGSKDNNKIRYYCNRSNRYGFESKSLNIRMPKKGGSTKIEGICPARIIADIDCNTGHVKVFYVKTHVGHKVGELRARRLTYEEQKEFADKMRAGVSLDRILEDAKIIRNGKVERKNLMLRDELKYIAKKFNVEISRNPSDVVATPVIVEEWNLDDENYELIFEIDAEMESEESDHFCKIQEVRQETVKLKEVENEFINEKYQDLNNERNQGEHIDDETWKNICFEDLKNRLMNLDTATFKNFIGKVNVDLDKLLPYTSTKRKMEKQNYHPQTQKKQRKQ